VRVSDLSSALPVPFRNMAGEVVPHAATQRKGAPKCGAALRQGASEKAAAGIQKDAGALEERDKGRKTADLERLWELCGEFEGLFLAQIMRVMQHSVLKSGFLQGGVVEDIFMDQFCMAVGKQAGKRASLGLAKMLYERLARVIEADATGAEKVRHRYAAGTRSVRSGTKPERGPERGIEGTLEVQKGVPEVVGKNISGTSSVGRGEMGVRTPHSRGT